MIAIVNAETNKPFDTRPPMPRYVTKYAKKKDIKLLREGSFLIGTPLLYRGLEEQSSAQKALSHDSEEGFVTTTVSDSIGRISVPELGLKNIVNVNCGSGLSFSEEFYCWLFCATGFAYKTDHHETMQNGIGNYCGNTEYSEFVVLDTEIFFPALYESARHKHPEIIYMDVGFVSYDGVEKLVSIDDFSAEIAAHPNRAQFQPFLKPPYFEPEQEIRAAFVTNPMLGSAEQGEPFIVKSLQLKKAVVKSSID